ncbi:MAG: thiamine diphosphokinase [Ruminococcus sp.]|nr:thiamine diphosphokinase [Ruminococcus sp.]
MQTLIVTGGNIEKDFALSFIKKLEPEYMIGVDKGLQFCYENNLRPDYIVGDFDSLPAHILEWYKEKSTIPIREYNPIKDATDTMIGLEKAMDMGSTEIWILGATGTRIDHVFCNLQILKNAWLRKIPTYLVDKYNKITIPVEKTFTVKKKEQYGEYISFFPLEATVENLCLRGFKYPLENYLLENQAGLGVSNEITEEIAEVAYTDGILVMMQSRD